MTKSTEARRENLVHIGDSVEKSHITVVRFATRRSATLRVNDKRLSNNRCVVIQTVRQSNAENE